MRRVLAAAGILFLLGSQGAWAQTANVNFSPDFQSSLTDDYGEREGEELRSAVERAIATAIERRGVAADARYSIEVLIIDAEPNRPTREQTRREPGLDSFRSISVGGAELRAVLRDHEGNIIREVTHRRYDHSVLDAQYSAATWYTARRAIREFAEKVATAYVGESS